jgi:hypothetical protein
MRHQVQHRLRGNLRFYRGHQLPGGMPDVQWESCQTTFREECHTDCTDKGGAIFCDGQFLKVSSLDDCAAELSSLLSISLDVSVDVDAQVDAIGDAAEDVGDGANDAVSAKRSCSTSGPRHRETREPRCSRPRCSWGWRWYGGARNA